MTYRLSATHLPVEISDCVCGIGPDDSTFIDKLQRSAPPGLRPERVAVRDGTGWLLGVALVKAD